MVERTLVLVKPDGVSKHLVGTVLQRFEQNGLQLAALKMLHLSTAQAEQFYQEHKSRAFFASLVRFMTSAPIVATVWEGEGAVLKARTLMGATNSLEAAPHTLRREYGTDNRCNLVHGSDSPKSAEREIPFFFKTDELFQYTVKDWQEAALQG